MLPAPSELRINCTEMKERNEVDANENQFCVNKSVLQTS